MKTDFKNRKEQIEKEFAPRLRAKLKEEGVGYLNRAQRRAINDALRDAAMVGACEERTRALELIRRYDAPLVATAITVVPVLTVLGYNET